MAETVPDLIQTVYLNQGRRQGFFWVEGGSRISDDRENGMGGEFGAYQQTLKMSSMIHCNKTFTWGHAGT